MMTTKPYLEYYTEDELEIILKAHEERDLCRGMDDCYNRGFRLGYDIGYKDGYINTPYKEFTD